MADESRGALPRGADVPADRPGREAEAAWLALVKQNPPHAPPPAIFQDACLELLRLYAIEDRWEDAAPLIWNAYDQAAPADRALWLIIRLRSELERIAPSETIVPLRRYVAADPEDGEALRALRAPSRPWAAGRTPQATFSFVSSGTPTTRGLARLSRDAAVAR